MKHLKLFGLAFVALAILVVPSRASMPTGPVSAKAGSGGVTAKTFVKLSAAGTIVASSAETDSVVGVCELTASANALTSYSPPGAKTTVTSGETIAVGDLLTSGTGGKAFVLDTNDEATQRVSAVALTACTGADKDVTCLVLTSTVEKRLARVEKTTSAADSLEIPVTYAIVEKTTGADAEALTLANGVPGQVLVIVLATDGGGTGTLTPAAATGFTTIVFADAGDTAALLWAGGGAGWVILGTAGVAAPPVISQ